MKIIEMHIYGYGQLENVHINNLADFQVFFGENEAGKSTIMAFIHGILFGFPSKQQSVVLRYEPKSSAKFGGKIRLYHEEFGYAVIERVKGKSSAGEVVVSLDNGTIGSDELLKELLSNFDKGLFQAIFSFNLHGLQNIHQMKSEEIGKFLFSAGTLGTERLSQTESTLQKEIESRFKPSGKKPILNEKLQALHELKAELNKASAKNLEYEKLIEKKSALKQEIENINNTLIEIREKVEKLMEWKKIQSLVKEERWTKREMAELGEFRFPARGIERAEKLNQLIHPYNAQMTSLNERIEGLKRESEFIHPDQDFLKNESAILIILEQIPLYEQLKLEKQQCDTKLVELEERLAGIKEKLHLPLGEEEIFSINTNIYMKNQVEMVSRKGQKLLEAKQELEDRFHEEKSVLEEMEKDLRIAVSQILPDLDRARLEEQVNEGDKNTTEIELKALQDKIEFYQRANQREQDAMVGLQKQKRIQFFTFELLLIGLTLYGLLSKQWILFLLGLICCLLIGVFWMKSSRQPKAKDGIHSVESLKEREKQLIDKLRSAEYMNIAVLQEKLNQDNLRKEKFQMLKMKVDQQHSQYEKIISKSEAWEMESSLHKEKLLTISSELKIPEYIAKSFLLEAFQLIEQSKMVGREKRHLLERLAQIDIEQAKIVKGLDFYSNHYLPEQPVDVHQAGYLLRNKLKEEHEKKIKWQERLSKLKDFEADMQQMKREQQHVQAEFNRLLAEANVDDEQQYYELGKKADKHARLKERLDDIGNQLQYSLVSESEREDLLKLHNVDELVEKANSEALGFQDQLKKLQEEHASIKYEIQILEEGGVYSDILHNYKQKKFELDESAKEWSVYCLAQDILSKTIEKYKNDHLPRMLKKAEEYLFFLTNGRYHKIHVQRSGTGFLIERTDHTLFEANELSQATTEQVYVSIRLALATTLYEQYCLPIIIDDSFVNFDARRTQKIIELLKRLGHNQILFFTCHAHLLANFNHDNILFLNNGVVQIHS